MSLYMYRTNEIFIAIKTLPPPDRVEIRFLFFSPFAPFLVLNFSPFLHPPFHPSFVVPPYRTYDHYQPTLSRTPPFPKLPKTTHTKKKKGEKGFEVVLVELLSRYNISWSVTHTSHPVKTPHFNFI